MRPETMLIQGDNGPIMINKSDFNPETMKTPDADDTAKVFETQELPSSNQTSENVEGAVHGVRPVFDVDGNQIGLITPATTTKPETMTTMNTVVTDSTLATPVNPNTAATGENTNTDDAGQTIQQEQAAHPGSELLVQKNTQTKRFVVVDKTATPIAHPGIDSDGYRTEGDAWKAILALGAPPAPAPADTTTTTE